MVCAGVPRPCPGDLTRRPSSRNPSIVHQDGIGIGQGHVMLSAELPQRITGDLQVLGVGITGQLGAAPAYPTLPPHCGHRERMGQHVSPPATWIPRNGGLLGCMGKSNSYR